ncbi:hypothetical protein, partial [Acidovorax delafieldii]|uniref:hypothetical protein n=2 Tax=Pseudomonadota TaxID=1224 RepID=UPI001ABF97E1
MQPGDHTPNYTSLTDVTVPRVSISWMNLIAPAAVLGLLAGASWAIAGLANTTISPKTMMRRTFSIATGSP